MFCTSMHVMYSKTINSHYESSMMLFWIRIDELNQKCYEMWIANLLNWIKPFEPTNLMGKFCSFTFDSIHRLINCYRRFARQKRWKRQTVVVFWSLCWTGGLPFLRFSPTKLLTTNKANEVKALLAARLAWCFYWMLLLNQNWWIESKMLWNVNGTFFEWNWDIWFPKTNC